MNRNIFSRIFRFYYEGFREMTWGRTLWLIIIVKLFIMFAVLKLFFFPDFLNSRFDDEQEKSEYIIEELTNQNK
ncbi:MAG TPA: DUF4492 domain-containing protein [Bacteroidales bacterium]|nr:DUF4492 domain-containing protein [Bacteroidales bacterium]HSA44844.1 DUF4492 domain-containing protein [Bacteroidales bacterium]